MTEQDHQEAKVVEPLAKFQSRVRPQGRVMVPIYIREYFGLQDGDFVIVIIRIPDQNRKIIGRVFAVAKLYDRGVFTIPKPVRDRFGLKVGDFVEILLVDYIHVKSLITNKMGPTLSPKVNLKPLTNSRSARYLSAFTIMISKGVTVPPTVTGCDGCDAGFFALFLK